MQKEFSIKIFEDIVEISLYEKPVLDELKKAMHEVAEIKGIYSRLWIFEKGIDLRGDELNNIAEVAKHILPVHSKAAIVAEDDLSFGLMRIHDVYRKQEQHETRVFRSKEKAINWLKGEHP